MSVVGDSVQHKPTSPATKRILLLTWPSGYRMFQWLISQAPQPSCVPGSSWDSRESPLQAQSGLSVFQGSGGKIVVVQSLTRVWLFATPWTQHARLPCPSPFPRACSNSCPWIGDAIQPSHPLSSPSPSAFNLSQHQGLFKWVGSLHQVVKVLELQLQHQPFQWAFRTDFL